MEIVLSEEGGFVDNPKDPGGVTGAGGITLRSVKLRDHDKDGHLDFDLDGDGDVDREDMLLLRANDPRVADVYLMDYWILVSKPDGISKAVTCADFGPRLALAVFDCSINSGPRTAVALLQRAVGAVEDGIPGPKTIAKVAAQAEALELYVAQRGLFYARQEARQFLGSGPVATEQAVSRFTKGAAPVFLNGWLRRLARVHTACVLMAHA